MDSEPKHTTEPGTLGTNVPSPVPRILVGVGEADEKNEEKS